VQNGNSHVLVLLAASLVLGAPSGTARAELAPPDYVDYHAARSYSEGLLLLRAGDAEAALEAADAALALMPDDPDSLYLKGICLLFAEEWTTAESVLQQVVTLRPDQAEAYHDLGLVQLRLGDGDGAAAAFARVSELQPDSWFGPYREAQTAALLRGDWATCEEHLAEAVERGFPWLASVPVDPEWASVAVEPAFLEMLERALRGGGGGIEAEVSPLP